MVLDLGLPHGPLLSTLAQIVFARKPELLISFFFLQPLDRQTDTKYRYVIDIIDIRLEKNFLLFSILMDGRRNNNLFAS